MNTGASQNASMVRSDIMKVSYPSFVDKPPSSTTPEGNMRPLAVSFTLNERGTRWRFTQLKREGNLCLYLKQCDGYVRLISSWEIIIPKIRPEERFPDGHVCPKREVYPKDRDWGIKGWTYMSEFEAEKAWTTKLDLLEAAS